MSGHSKWSTIKRKKGANDAKRGKLFAKLIRAIEVAAKKGGIDPDNNASLYQAISKAKALLTDFPPCIVIPITRAKLSSNLTFIPLLNSTSISNSSL